MKEATKHMDKQGYSGLCIGGPLHGERYESPFVGTRAFFVYQEPPTPPRGPLPADPEMPPRHVYRWNAVHGVWATADLLDEQVEFFLPPVNVRALTFFCEPTAAYLRFTMIACDEFGRRAQIQFSRDQIWHFDDALGEALSHDPRRDARDAFVWLHPILSYWAGILAGHLLKGGAP